MGSSRLRLPLLRLAAAFLIVLSIAAPAVRSGDAPAGPSDADATRSAVRGSSPPAATAPGETDAPSIPSIAVVILVEPKDASRQPSGRGKPTPPTGGAESGADAAADTAANPPSAGHRRDRGGVLPPPVPMAPARPAPQRRLPGPERREDESPTERLFPQLLAEKIDAAPAAAPRPMGVVRDRQSARHGGNGPRRGIDRRESNALALAPAHARGHAKDAPPAVEAFERDAAVLRRRLGKQLGDGFAILRHGPFLLASDLPAETLRDKPLRTLQVACRVLREEYFNATPKHTVVVFAFRDRQSYRYNLRRLWNETPISPYGHYNYVRKHVVCNAGTGLGTMVHEVVHSLMDADMPLAPVWVAEGVASLYEQCTYRDGTLKGLPNWRLPELQRKLDTPACPSLSEVMEMDDAAFKKDSESLHYAMVRHFCLYLQEQGKLGRLYRTFRDRYAEDPTGRRFVEEVCGDDLATVEAEWKAWVRTLRYDAGDDLAAR